MIEVSFIIPTLNAQSILEECLKSIRNQNFDEKKYEIIIADGGSSDKTIDIAQKYNSKIIKNPLKTAEAGKAAGIKHARGLYIALIDSDNLLPSKQWLKKMIEPLKKDNILIGSEPISFTYRPEAGFIERYSSLIGANDPYAFVTGIYDRRNKINFKWTGLNIKTKNFKNYIKIFLEPNSEIPTIGANGTIFKTSFLQKNLNSEYLFDIDILSQVLNSSQKTLVFAKVKTGIIHTFCESSIKKFIRKQQRRLTDYYFYNQFRQYNCNQTNKTGIIKFSLYTLLIIPVLIDSIKGYYHQKDMAWAFHPLACFLTLFIYSVTFLKYKLGILKSIDRLDWKQ